jgi:hypothetical protein
MLCITWQYGELMDQVLPASTRIHDLIDMHLMGWFSLREWDGLLSQRVGL